MISDKTSDKPPFPEAAGKFGPVSEARILPFRRGPARGSNAGLARGLSADLIPDLRKYHDNNAEDDYRHRMVVNLAAFLFVLLLIGVGYWIADTMASMRKNQDCVLSGRRGCTPVAVVPKDRW